MRTQDKGLAALTYAPCTIATQLLGIPVQIQVDSNYPFSETVHIVVSTECPIRFPLLLRVPTWAEGAHIILEDGRKEPMQPGTYYRVEQEWYRPTSICLHLPMQIHAQTRYHASVSVERGPLIYALKIEEEWKQIRGEPPYADWEVHPKVPWNYALKMERADPEHSCRVIFHSPGAVPFSPEGASVHLRVKGRRIPSWTLEHNAAGSLPISPVSSAQPIEDLTLIPYGCTNLRVTEFPVLDE